jgi:hypothetical protein
MFVSFSYSSSLLIFLGLLNGRSLAQIYNASMSVLTGWHIAEFLASLSASHSTTFVQSNRR